MFVDEQTVLRSLDIDSVVPFCQPLRELRTGRLMGFELLARWHHPEQGFVLPPAFVNVLEHSRLLTQLTEQILNKAFQSVATLIELPNLAVNISPLQLRDPSISTLIADLAKKNNFPLSRLTIEITETALVDNLELAQEIIKTFKRMGCQILLDDFGTGYSSLAHLQTFHFDGLKIDRSFIRGITKVREDRKIVAALIGLGQNLGITTIAEGIETEAQASMLLYLGCDVGQGYLYGRPQVLDSIPEQTHSAPPVITPRTSLLGKEPTLSSLESLPFERVAQLQAIYDGAPVGLCYLNKDLRYVSVNRQLSVIDDTPILAMLGRSVQSVFPAWFPIYEPYLRRALKGESLRDIEISRPSLQEEGIEQCLLVSMEPALDEDRAVIGLSLSVMDISERKRKEQALIESERKYRTIIDLNPQTPWIIDDTGKVIDFGSQWEHLTGNAREQVLGHAHLNNYVEEDRAHITWQINHSLSTAEPMDFEARAMRPDGTVFWVRIRCGCVLDENGKVTRLYGSTDDIDEVKRLRERVKALESKGKEE